MKPFVLLLFLLNFYFSYGFNSTDTIGFKKNSNFVSLGYGLLNYYDLVQSFLISDGSKYYSINVGPLFFKYERAVENKIGFGVAVSYQENINFTENADNFIYEIGSYQALSINAFFNHHYYRSKRLDAYWGFGYGHTWHRGTYEYLGFFIGNNNKNRYNEDGINLSLTAGLRYFIKPKFGIYSEVGFALSPIQFGIFNKF